MWLNLFSVFLLLVAALVDCDPCKFNRACDCQTSIALTTTVHCYNVSGTFPIFTIYNATLIESISVIGSFNYVPANAFNALVFVPLGASITIGRSKVSSEPLFIDDNAFQFVPIENLSFFIVTLPSVPTLALTGKTLKNLNFESGNLEVINDYAFEGLTITDSLRFLNNGLRSILPDGFTGFNSNGGIVLKTFYSDNNPLNEVPQALKKLKTGEVYLIRSNISKLTDNSFCNSPMCPTVKLDLTGNPINTISSNALQYMPLKELSLYSTNLTIIPPALVQIGYSLVTLDLRSNKFTDISTTTIFSSLRSLTSVNLDYNPITKMSSSSTYYGWGSKPMTELHLSNLNSLENIDISFLYGMGSFQSLTISTCPLLNSVLCSLCSQSSYYMPAHFNNLNLSGNDLRSIDSTFSTWLQQLQQQNATIDISYNYNYNCDTSISWMAKYVNCKPARIIATETLCANTKQPLSIYLRSNYETVCS